MRIHLFPPGFVNDSGFFAADHEVKPLETEALSSPDEKIRESVTRRQKVSASALRAPAVLKGAGQAAPRKKAQEKKDWIPACAGMTRKNKTTSSCYTMSFPRRRESRAIFPYISPRCLFLGSFPRRGSGTRRSLTAEARSAQAVTLLAAFGEFSDFFVWQGEGRFFKRIDLTVIRAGKTPFNEARQKKMNSQTPPKTSLTQHTTRTHLTPAPHNTKQTKALSAY